MVTAVLNAPQSIALILRDPRAFSGKPEGVQLSPADEQGLGPEAKSLLRVLLGYERTCLETALNLSSITLGRWEENEAGKLRLACGTVLAALALVEQELHIIMGGGDGVSAQPGRLVDPGLGQIFYHQLQHSPADPAQARGPARPRIRSRCRLSPFSINDGQLSR